MIKAVHLLDDFAMGGVMRALSIFEEPELSGIVQSRTVPVSAQDRIAPHYDADVIVLHLPPSWKRLPWLLSLRLRNPNARIVHVEHSYTRGFEAHNVSNKRRFNAMLRIALAIVDDIVCVSHAQRHWLIEASGVNASKFRTIHPDSGQEELTLLDPAAPDHTKPLKLAAYGRFSEVKNFTPLVEAVKSLGADVCSLSLGGTGPLQNEIERAATGATNVELVGMVDDVAGFLRQADAVVVPSLYEAFGLVATEARLAGRPILVADVDGLPEQAVKCGYVANCGSAQEIAAAIDQLRTMSLEEMGKQGRESALSHKSDVVGGWKTLLANG